MSRTYHTQSLHDDMVSKVAGHFVSLGHRNIQADHISHPNGRPSQYGSYIPDVTALHANTSKPIICEVETDDSIGDPHTYSQLRAFRQMANDLGGMLHVALPYQHDLATAQAIVGRWGIAVDQWWYGDNS